MRITEILAEAWSQKYKSSINCSHPKGFSQKAHCAGKKKHNESVEMEMVCEDCGMCQTHGNLSEIKQRLDAKCWKGKHKEGTKIKGGVRVNNCVPNESVEEAANAAQQAAIAIAKKKKSDISEGYTPSAGELARDLIKLPDPDFSKKYGMSKKQANQYYSSSKLKEQGVAEGLSLDEQFDAIEEMVESLAQHHGVDADEIWEDLESVDDHELLDESAAWRRKEGKSKKGGLNAKGVASYRRENPGSKLQTAVTTKPSKLKPGSKAAKRRKSFCARMGGVKGPMKKPNGKPTRKALALRKWNC